MFLDHKSEYYYDFWRSCDTEDWRNDAENTALITEINYILTDIHIETVILNNISQYYGFHWIFNKSVSSLGEKKRHLFIH